MCSVTTIGLMARDELVVHGAREHNLKDVTVRLPRHALICITGLSGSGKSSLAFDTIYAEGQRRYVESLSAYARQFLQMMEKPDVDSIDGLSPAISIDQKTTSRNPRSTVGTVTEIYDYLRLLYARVGRPHCPVCGRPIAGQSLEQIVDQVLRLPEGTRFTVNAPVVRDRKGEYKDVLEELRRDGFTRVKVDGEQRLLEDPIELDKKYKHTIEVVVDRLRMKPDLRTRLAQSIETAVALADGLVVIDVEDGEPMTFSENFACPEHGVSLPELQPRIFSFNSPHGACPRCTGPGRAAGDRPGPARPGSVALGRRGRARPVVGRQLELLRVRDPGDRRPLRDRPRHALVRAAGGPAEAVPVRDEGRARLRAVPQPDGPEALLHALVRGHRPQPRAALQGDRLVTAARADRGVHELPPVPGLQRRAAQARGAGGDRRRPEHPRVHEDVGVARDRVRRLARADRGRAADRRPDPQGDPRAAHVPRQRRRRLPPARPRGGHALRRRGPATPAGDADRLAARRRPLHPRRAVDRAAPARPDAADRDAGTAARPRQHRARRRARRADDARRRSPRRHGAGRRRARRARRRRGDGREGRARRAARSPASSSPGSGRSRCRSGARTRTARSSSAARRCTTSRGSTSSSPSGS